MELDEREFHILRWIHHFLRDGCASFVDMGGGKADGYHWDMVESLRVKGVTIVDSDALTVSLTENGAEIAEKHLDEFRIEENIGSLGERFLQLCLDEEGPMVWMRLDCVPKGYLPQHWTGEFEIDNIVALHCKACIEIEGIYPDVRLRVTDKGVRLCGKESKAE